MDCKPKCLYSTTLGMFCGTSVSNFVDHDVILSSSLLFARWGVLSLKHLNISEILDSTNMRFSSKEP